MGSNARAGWVGKDGRLPPSIRGVENPDGPGRTARRTSSGGRTDSIRPCVTGLKGALGRPRTVFPSASGGCRISDRELTRPNHAPINASHAWPLRCIRQALEPGAYPTACPRFISVWLIKRWLLDWPDSRCDMQKGVIEAVPARLWPFEPLACAKRKAGDHLFFAKPSSNNQKSKLF